MHVMRVERVPVLHRVFEVLHLVYAPFRHLSAALRAGGDRTGTVSLDDYPLERKEAE